MVNASNSAQRQATSSTNFDDAFSSASKLAEELQQNVDVLLLNQDVCKSHYHYATDQSPGKDSRGELPARGSRFSATISRFTLRYVDVKRLVVVVVVVFFFS